MCGVLWCAVPPVAAQPDQAAAAEERSQSVSMATFLLRAVVGAFGEGLDSILRLAPPPEEGSTPPALTRNHDTHRLSLGFTHAVPVHVAVVTPSTCTRAAEAWTIARPVAADALVPVSAEGAAAPAPGGAEKHPFSKPVGVVCVTATAAAVLSLHVFTLSVHPGHGVSRISTRRSRID